MHNLQTSLKFILGINPTKLGIQKNNIKFQPPVMFRYLFTGSSILLVFFLPVYSTCPRSIHPCSTHLMLLRAPPLSTIYIYIYFYNLHRSTYVHDQIVRGRLNPITDRGSNRKARPRPHLTDMFISTTYL